MKRLRCLCALLLTCCAFGVSAQSLPDLRIELADGSRFLLSWDQTPGFIVLEETDALGEWRPFAETPALSDRRFSVTVDRTASRRFFRLHDIGTPGVPPDPASVAPAVPQGVATTLIGSTAFLYTGENPVQTGVAPGTIDAKRGSVLRGKAIDRSGTPLSGVRITIPRHPEFGQTLSRVDGMFDLAVNGGGPLTVDYTLAGFLPAQRQVNAPWQDYVRVPDVALIPLDSSVTTIAANSGTTQVHRSTVSTDSEGSRRATLLFPPGTTATMVAADGSTQPLLQFNVRASEYTIGAKGPSAMPGELPPTSGYTYAVEFSVDEAIAAGAGAVTFNRPIPAYVENFLGFPVGENVPLGYYDRRAGIWVPSDNGRVIKITAINGGVATVDTVGSRGLPAIVIDSAELETLGSLYAVGRELWRMPVAHFSTWDANWGISPPSSAASPPEDPDVDQSLDEACTVSGNSVIEVQNQILGETIGVVGTPFALQYQSDRVPGRKCAYDVDIPLSGATLPGPVVRIELEIQIAGRFIRQSFPPAPNQKTTFTWDGRDVYGRTLQGSQFITVRTGYTYDAVYQQTPAFGYNGNGQLITGSRARQQVTLWRSWQDTVGTWDARGSGLGGWTLSAHHTFDPIARILYRGDGGRQSAQLTGPTIHHFAGTGIACSMLISGDFGPATKANLCPTGLATGPDDSVYIAESVNRVRRVHPGGIITTVAGTSETCYSGPCGDGGPATEALFGGAYAITIGPDNSFYVSEQSRSVVRRVGPDGIITTFAGTAVLGSSGDGGPATQARMGQGIRLAAGPDGSVYLADELNHRIRRVGTDGIITTVAGTGVNGFSSEGIPATLARVAGVRGVAVGRDGSLYFTEVGLHRIRRVTPDGIVRTIAGTGSAGFSGDGGSPTQAQLNTPSGIAVDLYGNAYFMDQGNRRIRWFRPGGTIGTLAGNGTTGPIIEGAAAAAVPLDALTHPWLAVGPDGSVYVTQDPSRRGVRRITPAGATLGPGGLTLPNPDGSELYIFGADGRHLQTKDALTGALLYEFAYDGAGRLATVRDVNDNVTIIERNVQGRPTAIVGPFGHRTALEVNANNYLSSFTNPADEAVGLAHASDGLLEAVMWPGGQVAVYGYDAAGRLSAATDPIGKITNFTRSGTNRDFTVTHTTPLGRTSAYRVEQLVNRSARLTITDCASGQSQSVIGFDGRATGSTPDGMTRSLVSGPDPRWGMRAPVATSLTTRTPGGLVNTTTVQRTATLAVAADPLSLISFSETVTSNSHAWRTTYDAPSRALVTTSPAGRRVRIILDERGRPAEEQFGDLHPVAYTYDQKGRLETASQGPGADKRVAVFAYGSDGFLSGVTEPLDRSTLFTNDAAGRIKTLTLPGGRVIGFDYDQTGNIRGITPPGRPEHVFAYTLRNEVELYTPPAVGEDAQTRFAYDDDRNPARIDHLDGSAVQFGYAGGTCNLGLVDLGNRQRTYGYNAAGQVTSLVASQGISLTRAYDGGMFKNAIWSGVVAGSAGLIYDSDFRISSLDVNGTNPIVVNYDADGLPIQVGALVLTRNAANGFVTGTVLGAMNDTTTYDGFGAPASYTARHNGMTVYSAVYTRDSLGRVSRINRTIGITARIFDYTYDTAGRLSEVRHDGVLVANFDYDPNGNRLTANCDTQDRLTAYESTTYAHNSKGERTAKTTAGQTTRYQYEGLGSLTGVTLPDATQIEYLLDAEDRRVGKRVNNTLVQAFLYQDGLRPIAELDGSGTVVSRFIYATERNVPDYMIKGGVTYRIITDHLGSPRLVMDIATGQIIQQMDHDEFGRVILDTNPGFQPFGFAGGIYDRHTGLVHFGAREYDPECGRWTTKDPIGFGGGDGNLYAYADNDPVNNVDPGGLCSNTVDCTCLRQPATCAMAGLAARAAPVAGAAASAAGGAQRVINSCPAAAQVLPAANRALAAPNPIVNMFTGQNAAIPHHLRNVAVAIRNLRPDLSLLDAVKVAHNLARNLPTGWRGLRNVIAWGQLARLLNIELPK